MAMHTQLTQETDPALTLSSCLDTYNIYNYVRLDVELGDYTSHT